jgi:hypothetical protein
LEGTGCAGEESEDCCGVYLHCVKCKWWDMWCSAAYGIGELSSVMMLYLLLSFISSLEQERNAIHHVGLADETDDGE